MPFPVVAAAIGTVARTATGVASRGAMTSARFGLRGATNTTIGRSLSSSQFGGTNSNVNITGPAVHEMLGRTPQ